MYEYGQGVGKDEVEAVKWYRKSAEQGDARAQCNLGVWNESDSFYMFDAGYVRVPKGFEIAGEDKIFHRAEARFLWGNRIEVWSEEVPEPVAVRYAFANWCPEANVVTTQGQPLMPFRTDDWPVNDAFENNSNR